MMLWGASAVQGDKIMWPVFEILDQFWCRAGVVAHAAAVRKADAQAARSQGAQPKGSSRPPSKVQPLLILAPYTARLAH